MKYGLLAAALVCAGFFSGVRAEEALSPWGVCAHLNRADSEFNYRTDEQLRLMKEAGIKSVRMDIGFGLISRKPDQYDFSHMDKVWEKLDRNGISLMPILSAYSWELKQSRPDVDPMHDHPEAWRGYVRALAEHFKGKIRVWSFWNEPDGGFWHPKPDPAQYVKLLKITHEELKKADPENQVMLGGIGANFLKDVYKLGGSGYFDLISTHPYGWGGDRRRGFDRTLDELRDILRRHGDGSKPVWFTECGSSSARNEFVELQPEAIFKALQLAGEKIGRPLDREKKYRVGVPVLSDAGPDDFNRTRPWLPGVKFVPVPVRKLKTLDPAEIPVVLACENESIAEEFIQPLQNYVRRGGIILAFGRIPFYTLNYVNRLGSRAARGAADELYRTFRMGWHASWNRAGVPVETAEVRPAPEMEKLGFKASRGHANRYLNGDMNRENVNYTPILRAVADGRAVGDTLSLYTFKDWKGAIIGCTLIKLTNFVTPQEQADLAQTFSLYSLSRGVPRFYFYVFRDTGRSLGEYEDNFGMVTRDLHPKPLYHAYREMTDALGACPKFLKRFPAPEGFLMMLFERKEDGKKVLAFWSTDAEKPYAVEGVGTFKDGSVHFVTDADENKEYRLIAQ